MTPSEASRSEIESFNTPSPADYLADLRTAIDEIDDRFVKLLAERFEVTREVGQLKADLGMPAIDSKREDQVDEKARRLADANGLDANLVSEVLRSIIDRVVAEHRTMADDAARSIRESPASESPASESPASETSASETSTS